VALVQCSRPFCRSVPFQYICGKPYQQIRKLSTLANSNVNAIKDIPGSVIYTLDRKLFFKIFGVSLVTQFFAWILMADTITLNNRDTPEAKRKRWLWFSLGAGIGTLFFLGGKLIVGRYVAKLVVFPGGKSVEISTNTFFGKNKLRVIPSEKIIAPKKSFNYSEFSRDPSKMLTFGIEGEKLSYLVDPAGKIENPGAFEQFMNGYKQIKT